MEINQLITEARIIQAQSDDAKSNEIEKAINALMVSKTDEAIEFAINVLKTEMKG